MMLKKDERTVKKTHVILGCMRPVTCFLGMQRSSCQETIRSPRRHVPQRILFWHKTSKQPKNTCCPRRHVPQHTLSWHLAPVPPKMHTPSPHEVTPACRFLADNPQGAKKAHAVPAGMCPSTRFLGTHRPDCQKNKRCPRWHVPRRMLSWHKTPEPPRKHMLCVQIHRQPHIPISLFCFHQEKS